MSVTPRRLSRTTVYVLLTALVITGAVFIFLHYRGGLNPGQFLEIRDAYTKKLYGKWPLEKNGEFAVEFIHSVHLSSVRESFIIEDGSIRPFKVRFSSFGAGMLSDLGEGETLSRDGEALVITGFKTSFRELRYIVGTVSDHLLFINGDTISLRELCGRNAHITIGVR